MYQPGEIVNVAYPFSELNTPKRRPVLILAICDNPENYLVTFISSNLSTASAHSVSISESHPGWRSTGLKRAGLVRVDRITTLHVSVISGAIGFLPRDLMRAVRNQLQGLFSSNA